MGFYKNIGTFNNIRKAVEDSFNTSLSYQEKSGMLKSVIPKAKVVIDSDDHMILSSETYTDVQYDIDLSNELRSLYTIIVDKCTEIGVDIATINPKEFNIAAASFCSLFAEARIEYSKNKIVIILRGWGEQLIFSHRSSHYRNKQAYATYNEKHRIELDIKDNPVRICMDLRNYITKSIEDLSNGKLSSIQVKTGIEEYIKRLK